VNTALLLKGAQQFGLELDDMAIERFSQYLSELKRWNRAVNLTAILQDDQVIVKHFVDSLSIVPLINENSRLLDVGSGAGLPCLVVAIMRNDLAITSLDAVGKKAGFQRHICRMLKLDHVTVLHERLERLASQPSQRYDLITSRAFSDIVRFVQATASLLLPGGRLVAMVAGGAHEVLSPEFSEVCAMHGLEHQQSYHYELPRGMGGRNLVVLRHKSL